MSVFSKNLRCLRERKGLKLSDFEQHSIKSGTMSNYELGKTEPKLETIMFFASFFKVSVDNLLYANLERYYKELDDPNGIFSQKNVHPLKSSKSSTQNTDSSTQTVHPLAEFDPHVSVVQAKTMTEAEQGIPLIPLEAAAGPFLGNSAQIFDYDCERYVVPEFSKADFLIRVMGDSMEPYYIAGDMVACKKLNLDTFFQWNEVYLIDSEQGVLIKRVKPGSTPETLSLVSDNKAYDPVELERAEVYGLARVLGLLRFN